MQRTMLKSKLHRVHVTHSELHYEGSCAIDEALLEAADISEYEKIAIYNVTNGERFTTYANGAAAHKAKPDDIVIIATYAQYNAIELETFAPTLVYVDDFNRIKELKSKIPAQAA
jgi:aspartate 1-decarboxylase